MRRFVATVFDEWVYSTAMYTSDMYEDLLGSVDQYGLQAIADAVSGSSVTLTVAVESSTDGRSWTSHGNLISGASIDVLMTNVAVGSDNGSTVKNRRVRFRLALGGTTPQAQVRLTVCGRDSSKGRAPRSAGGPSPMEMGGSPMAGDARFPTGAAAAPTARIAGLPASAAVTAASPARLPNTGAGAGGGALPPARTQPRSKGKAG